MDTLEIPSIPPELGVRASKVAPVIVVTDGQAQSNAAMVVGRLFAGSPDALRLVTVADLEIRCGDPAAAIAKLAHKTGATLVVCGLGKHRIADRVFGDETALRLMRLADVPVFAVAEGMSHAPQRIVVACDFSETSLRAARLSIELASSNATLYLAHVAPRDSGQYEGSGWAAAYKQDATEGLAKTLEQLRPPAGMLVHSVVLQGDAATELLALAGSVKADLIATGSHGHPFVARMLIGSVATRIIRMSTRSVLIVPNAAVMTDAGVRLSPTSRC